MEADPLVIVCLSLSDFRQTEGVGFRANLVLKPEEKGQEFLHTLPRAWVQPLFQEQKSYKPQLGLKKKSGSKRNSDIYTPVKEAGLALTKNLNTSLKQKFNLFNVIKRYLLKVKPDVSKMALYRTLMKKIFT